MKKICIILVAAITLASCGGSKPAAGTTNNTTVGAPSADNDGSSYEKAIFIDEKNEMAGVAAEYKWLKANHPGYKTISQSLDHKDKKSYDIITILTAGGKKMKVYFDITQFYGKM